MDYIVSRKVAEAAESIMNYYNEAGNINDAALLEDLVVLTKEYLNEHPTLVVIRTV